MPKQSEPPLWEVSGARLRDIAHRWHRALTSTGDAPCQSAAEEFERLTKQLIELLDTDAFAPEKARVIGAALVRLGYSQPDVLSRSLDILARQIAQDLPIYQMPSLNSRLLTIISELARGFFQQSTRDKLNKLRQRSEALARTNMELRNEIADLKRTERTSAETEEMYRVLAEEGFTERRQTEDALRYRTKQLKALSAVGLELTAQLDLDVLLHSIVARAVDLLKGHSGQLLLNRPGQDVLRVVTIFGDTSGSVGDMFRPSEGLCGRVWETGKPQVANCVQRQEGGIVESMVGVPICWGDLFLGVLLVGAAIPRAFSSSDVELLSIFATQAAIAIRNARLYKRERKRARQLSVVNQVARKAVSILDPEQLLQEIVTEIQQGFNYYNVVLLLLDEERQELGNQAIAGGFANEAAPDYRQSVGVGIIGQVAQEGRTLLANDVSKAPQYIKGFEEPVPTKAELCVPLKLAGKVIGVLDVQETRLYAFDQTDVIAMETLADQIAVAIENARLYEQAQRDAETRSILLREVNHRVKNNLMAIVGLIYTEQNRLKTEERLIYQPILQDIINQIKGLTTAHNLLSASGWQALQLSDLVNQVIHSTLQAAPDSGRVTVDVTPSPVMIPPNQAQNIALIISELTTNTIKYALIERETVRITVTIEVDNGMVQLEFRNNGPDYPEDVLQSESYEGGFNLIQNIVRGSLRGEFSLQNEQGPVALIQFEA